MIEPEFGAAPPSAWSIEPVDLDEAGTGTSEILAHGNFLTIRRDAVTLPDGTASTREYVVHPGAVAVVAFLDEEGGERVVVEWQYRYPVEQVMLEFPAGKLDAGERQIDCAQRELQEETGFTAELWAPAGIFYPAISYSTEFIGIWFARGLRSGPRALDVGEFVEVRSSTVDELLTACVDGRVTDGKTLACAFHLQSLMSGRWKPDWQTLAYWRGHEGRDATSPRIERTLKGAASDGMSEATG
jgi:ADP-ribose pyrophosphatase